MFFSMMYFARLDANRPELLVIQHRQPAAGGMHECSPFTRSSTIVNDFACVNV